jgi:hypothetical protein
VTLFDSLDSAPPAPPAPPLPSSSSSGVVVWPAHPSGSAAADTSSPTAVQPTKVPTILRFIVPLS